MRAAVVCALLLIAMPALASTEPPREPSFLHGAGEVALGIVTTFPETVIYETVNGPPVAGTLVGIIAGIPKALQRTVAGVVEMAQGFDPWGAKQ